VKRSSRVDDWLRATLAAAVVLCAVGLLLASLFGISYVCVTYMGIPISIGLPVAVKIVGLVILTYGLFMALWLFRERGPANVALSTRLTFSKMLGVVPISNGSERKEPLVVSGPQKYVRRPLYSGVAAMTLGWGLLNGSILDLVAAVLIILWFTIVQIPFEEKELRILFKDDYEDYAKETPMLVPFAKPRRRALVAPVLGQRQLHITHPTSNVVLNLEDS